MLTPIVISYAHHLAGIRDSDICKDLILHPFLQIFFLIALFTIYISYGLQTLQMKV